MRPKDEDLKIEIIITYGDKKFPAYYNLENKDQTWENVYSLSKHIGVVIMQTLHKNNIILNPYDVQI
jgi:hypothetical protein